MQLDVENKVYLIAAGSKGLGFATAKALALDGAIVSIGSRDQVHLDLAVQQLRDFSVPMSHILSTQLDMANADSINAWVDKTVIEFQRIDGVLVNAGGPPPGGFDDFDDAAWEAAFNLTLMSAVRLVRAALPQLRQRKQASVLMLTSSSVKEPIDILLLSNVMRSGVSALAKSLSKQLAVDGVRVNCLVPGLIATDRMQQLDTAAAAVRGVSFEQARAQNAGNIPMARYGEADEFGQAAAFLLSPSASYITGATLVVDGGAMKSV